MLDRETPRRRPTGKPQGFQRWESLLFLHWEVPAPLLRSVVPQGMELDTFEDRAFIGLVPFVMKGVRPRWAPRALAFNFLETNVRTYVHRQGKPGVYFLSLEAASRIAVTIARAFWGLPYFHADMQMTCGDNRRVTYRSKRTKRAGYLQASYRVGEPLGTLAPDSLEFFFLERYLLFVERRGVIYEGQVYHTPYPAYRVDLLDHEQDLLTQAAVPVQGKPTFAHYSPGVDVEVFSLRPT